MNALSFIKIAVAATWVASWSLTPGCATGPTQRSDASDAQSLREIRDVVQRYETALNASAVEDVLGLYGDEPVFMPQHAPALVGRDAVRAGYKQVFETIQLDIRFEIHELQQLGDWAWARTSSAGRTRTVAEGSESLEGNNELFLFRREEGVWKIHRYLFSTNRPRH